MITNDSILKKISPRKNPMVIFEDMVKKGKLFFMQFTLLFYAIIF